MKYFDLHCDTATALFDKGETLDSSSCQISKRTVLQFEKYSQVIAVFSKPSLGDDECFNRFFKVKDNFTTSNNIDLSLTSNDISDNKNNYILSIEDARLFSNDISRVRQVYDEGVRIITPLWSGKTCVGGSYDTDEGLTEFGRSLIKECCSLGIVPDVSHASVKSTIEILEIAAEYKASVIASHSNSFSVHPHPRNANDDVLRAISSCGGVAGICLHSPHLGDGTPGIVEICRHIYHMAEITSEDFVCLGCDLDGTDKLPPPFHDQSGIPKLYNKLHELGFGEEFLEKLFYKNAYNFFKSAL